MPEFLNTPEIAVDSEDADKNKVFGVLSYFGILWLVGLLAAPDSKYAKFHANQGLVLFLAEIVLNIVVAILAAIFGIIGHGLGVLSSILYGVVELASIGMMVFGIVYAAKGMAKELPLIGKLHLLDKNNA